MWSKLNAKINQLNSTQRLIIIIITVTIILSCGIVIFFLVNKSDSQVSSRPATQISTTTEDDTTTATTETDTVATTTTSSSNQDQRPQLMSIPIKQAEEKSTNSQTTQSTTTKPTTGSTTSSTTSTTTSKPATETTVDPVCEGDKITSQSCILQKMYGTTYVTNQRFAYDLSSYYSRILSHVTPNITSEMYLNGAASSEALNMITTDLKREETDSVRVEFYATLVDDSWKVDWRVTVARKTGDKSHTVYSQTARYRLSESESKAITDRYVSQYTKELRETQALYESTYLTWYNSQTNR